MDIFFIAVTCYLIGSIPFGFILTKIFLKKDVREIGSGNIGATNVLRTGNKTVGYLTLILDILKAVIPVMYIKFFFPRFYIYFCFMCILRSCISSLVKVQRRKRCCYFRWNLICYRYLSWSSLYHFMVYNIFYF